MSDVNPITPEPVVEPAAVEPAPLHPAWEQALEAIPDMLRPAIVDQIRKSDFEANKAIEAARGTIDPAWQSFLADAQGAGATPGDLINSWNAAQELVRDPLTFQKNLNTRIDQLVAMGQLTRAEGQQAKQEVAGEVSQELGNLDTPEAKRIADLEKQIADLSGTVQQDLSAREQQQIDQQAQAYGDRFFAEVASQFAADPALANAAQQTQVVVAQLADKKIELDPTGTLTEAQAIAASIRELKAWGNQQQPAAQQQAMPVGTGSGLPAPAAQKFVTENDRNAAMLAEAARVLST
jgi:polyhydroxyalkanoate synthesis regulator phasin